MNTILTSLFFLIPLAADAAQCKVNGQWYPYSHPLCSGVETTSGNGSQRDQFFRAQTGNPMSLFRSDYGSQSGYVDRYGTLHDEHGLPSGRFLDDGTVLDASGLPVGRVEPNGTVLDGTGMPVGHLAPDGTVLDMTGLPAGHLRY